MSEDQTPLETWNRAKTLLLESLYKPDHQLRSCAYNQASFLRCLQGVGAPSGVNSSMSYTHSRASYLAHFFCMFVRSGANSPRM